MKKYNNNNFNINNVGQSVELYGWVARKRNLGGLIFIDLRDRSGIIQVVIRPNNKYYNIAEKLKNEYVIKIIGEVIVRENKNYNISSGEIEVEVKELIILNEASDVPFEIVNNTSALEETRLKYRFLDLRREIIKTNLLTRHKIVSTVRDYLNNNEFIEIETPILSKSTPEGARDYLVPSRISKGSFYALPQSPQIYKQLLMVGGLEKYYQIARCFRDEDLRADRQPEFTQIDIEMSFVDENDVMTITEGLFKKLFSDIKGIELKTPFLKMTYEDAINLYGIDKPDLRFDMQIKDITNIFKNTDFTLFKNIIDDNGIINCLIVKNKADEFSRKEIDKLTEYCKTYRANELAWLKFNDNQFTGSIVKIIDNNIGDELKKSLDLEDNDLILIVGDKKDVVKTSLGALRLKLGKDLSLIDKNDYKILWVTDFPLFEYSEEDKRYYASHHPFTSPKDTDIDKINSRPKECRAKAYDIVLNGYEVGGGSIRIHNYQTQQKMFEALNLSQEEIESKFGFLIEAFKYGTPPHGGIALGLERITMLLCQTENIKDVIAFPKTASASCLMTSAPSEVSLIQLEELGIKYKNNA